LLQCLGSRKMRLSGLAQFLHILFGRFLAHFHRTELGGPVARGPRVETRALLSRVRQQVRLPLGRAQAVDPSSDGRDHQRRGAARLLAQARVPRWWSGCCCPHREDPPTGDRS